MRVITLLLVSFFLVACTTQGTSVLTDRADTFVEATTPEQRALRACMATAILSEVWAYRLIHLGSTADEREAARVAMTNMLESIADLRLNDGIWFETQMFYATHTMLRSAAPAVKGRILGGVAQGLGGDIMGLVRGLKTTAIQVALAKVMKRDVVNLFETMNTTEDLKIGWAACRFRIEGNMDKLS